VKGREWSCVESVVVACEGEEGSWRGRRGGILNELGGGDEEVRSLRGGFCSEGWEEGIISGEPGGGGEIVRQASSNWDSVSGTRGWGIGWEELDGICVVVAFACDIEAALGVSDISSDS